MIETAVETAHQVRDIAEQVRDVSLQAKDVAQEAFGDLSDIRKQIHKPKRSSHRGRWFLLIVAALGLTAVAVYVARQRAAEIDVREVAPDPFGAAVEDLSSRTGV